MTTETVAWTPVRFMCGHYLDMGEKTETEGVSRKMADFIPVASWSDCPMCGSSTGIASEPLELGVIRHLVHNDLYYRVINPEHKRFADANFRKARFMFPFHGARLWEACPECGGTH